MSAAPAPLVPAAIHERLELSLFRVETASYPALDIRGMERPHWIVSHVLAGSVETRTGGGRWRAGRGEVMVHPPHLPFDERAPGPGTHQWMEFDLAASPGLDLLRLHPVAPVVPLRSPGDYSAAFEALRQVWAGPAGPARDLRAFGRAAELLGMVLDGWQAAGAAPRPLALRTGHDRFLEVLAYMNEHLHEKVTRDDLAGRACLHPGYFDRAFRAAYGAPPMRLLRDLRLRRARQILETTDETLDAVARACGLGDAAYLSRVFRARYGQTPGRYRESAKRTRQSYIGP